MNEASDRTVKNKRLVTKLTIFAIFMFAFCYYLLPPMYNVLCKTLGINGKISGQTAPSSHQPVDLTRTITVQFLTTTNAQLPWQFHPNVQQIKVHPGEKKRVTFFAENDAGAAMTVQAIPSISPNIVAKYLHKTQCFCFEKQTLAAGKSRDMPMIFYVDPSLPKEYKTITISYTLFDTQGIKTKKNVTKGKIAA